MYNDTVNCTENLFLPPERLYILSMIMSTPLRNKGRNPLPLPLVKSNLKYRSATFFRLNSDRALMGFHNVVGDTHA